MLSIFAQLVIVLAVMMGGWPAATDLFVGEKERKTMEALLMTTVKRIHIIVGKWLTIAAIEVYSGLFSVIALIISVSLFTENIAQALNFGENLGSFAIGIAAGIILFSLLVSSLEMILSMLANNMKEATNFISPVSILAIIPYFVLIGISANELEAIHFVIPFFNIYALITQLIYGIFDAASLLLVAGSSAVFILIIFLIGLAMFKKSKWILGKS